MEAELVVLPVPATPAGAPVTALSVCLELAGITTGPVFQGVAKKNEPTGQPVRPDAINTVVQGYGR